MTYKMNIDLKLTVAQYQIKYWPVGIFQYSIVRIRIGVADISDISDAERDELNFIYLKELLKTTKYLWLATGDLEITRTDWLLQGTFLELSQPTHTQTPVYFVLHDIGLMWTGQELLSSKGYDSFKIPFFDR